MLRLLLVSMKRVEHETIFEIKVKPRVNHMYLSNRFLVSI